MMQKTPHQNEQEIIEKAKNHVRHTQTIHDFTDGILYKMHQCYLAGYMQAQADMPSEWQNGYDAGFQVYYEKYESLKKALADLVEREYRMK